MKQVYEEMQIDEHTRILDIGCGAGRFSLALAKSGAQVTGTDVSSEMIMAAKELAEKEHQKNVSFFMLIGAVWKLKNGIFEKF